MQPVSTTHSKSKRIFGLPVFEWVLLLMCVSLMATAWMFMSDRSASQVSFHKGFTDRLVEYRANLEDAPLENSMDVMALDLRQCADRSEVVWYHGQSSRGWFDVDVSEAHAQGASAFRVCMRQQIDSLASILDVSAKAKLIAALDEPS